jgi:asparagine synthase (glutamine-hydrolysing)
MCGITGWVDFDRDLRAERSTLEAMTATMTCRGPDAGGVWCCARAGIGHRRLSVIDIEGGAQPMRSPGNRDVVLTFSGEIYNFPELRHELQAYGHVFRTQSDTEVLLRSYLQWDAGCLPRLNGMFAFAVWDGRHEELLLARDRLGVKPLYYAPLANGVLFGSEPKAILAHRGFRAEIDAEGLAELFSQAGTATPGHGMYRGLAQVRPGCVVHVTRGGVRPAVYWELESHEHADDLPTTVATVRDLLADTVNRQTVADVPVCSLLSGGLDSSVVAALANRASTRSGRGKLSTFSVDFAGSQAHFRPDQLRPSHDEPFARAAAEHIGARHQTVVLDAGDLVEAQWAPLAAHDMPTMGDMWTSMYLLSREVRRQSTVALSGESADEVFGGYPWYHIPALLAADTFPWAAGGSWAPLLQPDVASRIRLDEYAADRYSQARAEVPRLPGEDPHDRRIREVLYLGLTRWLPMLLDRKDRLSMATGLEVRVPFCDHRLVEYVWNIPWPVKETGGIEKGLLRAAADGLLPDTLLSRRKSAYPGVATPGYAEAIDAQMRDLLARPDAPVFTLISHGKLAAAYASDPTLAGYQAIRPSSTAPAAFLLDINEWLRRYNIRIR